MKIGHTKTHTVDSASLKNMLRNHKAPTDENSGYQQRKDPIFSTGVAPFGNRVLATANHELGPTMTVSYPEKAKAQSILETGTSQTKTEESISADVYSDMVSKISVLNGEIANYKSREKKFMAKIYALENEKGLLIQALEQSQKKLQDTVTKAKDEKKKMTSVIDSYKVSIQTLEKQKSNHTVDSTQASVNSNKTSRFSIYNSETFNNFEILLQKFEDITQNSNALIEENTQIKTDLENYKKYSESLKNYVEHHKSQMKKQENIQSSIIEKSKSVITENLCFKQYLRNILFTNKENDPSQTNKIAKSKNSLIKAAPLPSYLKALSMAIPDKEEQES